MHRFIVAPENCREGWVEVTGTEVHHLRNVLRLNRGDQVEVLDGRGNCLTVELTELNSRRALGKILQSRQEETAPVTISMGLAILKSKAMETAIRKSVELGVHQIVPLECRNSVPRLNTKEVSGRVAKWNRIAGEAVKQCGRYTLPEVLAPQTVAAFCKSREEDGLKLFFWENERTTRLNDINTEMGQGSIVFLVGPEGGFTEEEAGQAKEAGFSPVSLGPRILRAETVPLVALTLLQYRWGDLSNR